jgi:hypothetical protein
MNVASNRWQEVALDVLFGVQLTVSKDRWLCGNETFTNSLKLNNKKKSIVSFIRFKQRN